MRSVRGLRQVCCRAGASSSSAGGQDVAGSASAVVAGAGVAWASFGSSIAVRGTEAVPVWSGDALSWLSSSRSYRSGSGGDDDASASVQSLLEALRKHSSNHARTHEDASSLGNLGDDGDADPPGSMGVIPEGEARRVMRDPMAMLMMSRGVPLGISLRVRSGEEERPDTMTRLPGTAAGSLQARPALQPRRGGRRRIPRPVETGIAPPGRRSRMPALQEQRHGESRNPGVASPVRISELVQQLTLAHRMAQAETASSAQQRHHGGNQEESMGGHVQPLRSPGLRAAPGDGWGTTRDSPEAISRAIAEANARVAGQGGGSEGEGGEGEGGEEGVDDELRLSIAEEALGTVDAHVDEIKRLDEIFEVLAQVPWLDDGDVDERELRGVVSVGLLGTLEEVGWQIRRGVERIWAGERDSESICEGLPARERLALDSILFHTQVLEGKYGAPRAFIPKDSMLLQQPAAEAGSGGGKREGSGQ